LINKEKLVDICTLNPLDVFYLQLIFFFKTRDSFYKIGAAGRILLK